MRVHIVADTGPALLLGGLLASSGHIVSVEPEVPVLRLILPGGWLSVRPLGPEGASQAELVIDGEGGEGSAAPREAAGRSDSPRLLRVRSGTGGGWACGGQGRIECIVLADILSDGPTHVEAVDAPPTLILPQQAGLRRLVAPFRKHGVDVVESSQTAGQCGSLLVFRLLDLPLALCNTCLATFLSFEEGRRIAEAVLEEGLGVAEKGALPLAGLPRLDPRGLLRDLRRAPAAYEAKRYAPGRPSGPLVAALLRGGETGGLVPQRGFLRRAAELGVSVVWNWRLVELLPRVARAGFVRGPRELLRAVA